MMNKPDHAIIIDGVDKIYAPQKTKGSKEAVQVHALKNVCLKIPRGSLFGLLGPNGAGKSTLINIMAGLTLKNYGQVKIWDYDIDTQTRQARAAIGIVPQELNIDPFFTPSELLEVQAGLYGVPKSERRTDAILEMVGLYEKRNSYARALSGGMRRRLLIAKALVHNPPILVLDEPTAGVDIELRKQLWENVVRLNRNGTTVLLTTHYLEEAEQLCDHIAIINKGNLVANEPKKQLLSRIDAKIMRVSLAEQIDIIPEALKPFNPTLEIDEDSKLSILQFSYQPSHNNVGEIIRQLGALSSLSIKDISTIEADLEDIFLQLTKD